MSILFLILKIIGILILIPIVLLLILLIFPICYQMEGDFDGKTPKAQAGVSWAVVFLRAKAFYEEELNFAIRIFGIPVYDSRKDHWSVLGEHPEKNKKKNEKKRKKRSDSKKKSKKKKKTEVKKEKQSIPSKKTEKKIIQESVPKKEKKTSEDVLDLTWDEKEESGRSTTRNTQRKSEDTIPKKETEKQADKEKEFFGKRIVNFLKKCYNKCKNFITKISDRGDF